jgi:predicted TIM-barrel fold metal-dependent hydrolase
VTLPNPDGGMTLHEDLDVIDLHNHIGDLRATGLSEAVDGEQPDLDVDMATRLEILDDRGVGQAVVIAGHGYLRPDGIVDTCRVNDAVAAYRDRRPDRFPAAIGIVEPLYGERGLPELDRCATELGLRGISFHTRFQGVSVDSPWVRRYLERMGELGLVPFMHAVGESASELLWKIDMLATDLPELPMVVLDAFSTFEQCTQVPHLAARHPQLTFDTAITHSFSFVRSIVDRFGASRVAYGSDLHNAPRGTAPLLHCLPDILASDLSPEDKALIVGDNIRAILGIAPP